MRIHAISHWPLVDMNQTHALKNKKQFFIRSELKFICLEDLIALYRNADRPVTLLREGA